MKRRNPQQKQPSQWKYKLIAFLLISCCLGSFALMHKWHNRIKFQLLSQKPKISFLFIARNRLPLDLVWDEFFQGAKEPLFSIFVHSRPGFVFSKTTTKSAYFHSRQVSDSIQVDWGEASMIQAERILLQHALKDPLNQKFVFLSDRISVGTHNFLLLEAVACLTLMMQKTTKILLLSHIILQSHSPFLDDPYKLAFGDTAGLASNSSC